MGRLVLVPTPLGNLEDITLRAIKELKSCDFCLAEDTRTTGKLLHLLNIDASLVSYHMHNEHKMLDRLVERIATSAGHAVLVSDAGTPGISDPGFLLVRACLAAGISVEVLPGPTAFVPALVASGLPCDRFVFEGFLPLKKGRQTRMKELAEEVRTVVFYESPHKLTKTLHELVTYFGPERKASVAREISKLHETHHRGSLAELSAYFSENPPRGEMVVVVSGRS